MEKSIGTTALAAMVVAVAYFTKNEAACFFIALVGMYAIWFD